LVIRGQEAQRFTLDGHDTSKAWVMKTNIPYNNQILGIVSTSPAAVYGDEIFAPSENPRPIALVGRVPVKVSNENGEVQAGDYLTSSTTPGKAMKATRPGMVIGQALSSSLGSGNVVVFVNPMYYDPTVQITEDGTVQLQRNTATTELVANTDTQAAYIVKQQGSGDILQLQQNDVTRFLVKNDGSTIISGNANTTPTSLLVVKADEQEVLTVNSRGDLDTQGVIVMRDNNFAGSIATLADGTAEITFTYDLGTGKPVIQLTPESEVPVFAQIKEWRKDQNQNFTGFIIKTFGLDGQPASSIVHYLVTGKQNGYETFGQALPVTNMPVTQTLSVSGGGPTTTPDTTTPTEPAPAVAGDATPTSETASPSPTVDPAQTDTTTTTPTATPVDSPTSSDPLAPSTTTTTP
jgi:hypothetical protein